MGWWTALWLGSYIWFAIYWLYDGYVSSADYDAKRFSFQTGLIISSIWIAFGVVIPLLALSLKRGGLFNWLSHNRQKRWFPGFVLGIACIVAIAALFFVSFITWNYGFTGS